MSIFAQLDENEKAPAGVTSTQLASALAAGKAVADSGLPTSKITEAITRASASKEARATGFLMSKLTNDLSDAVVLMVSDSTGNESDEQLKLLTDWYAAQFPVFTVLYYVWNTSTDDYDTPVTVRTGTGSHTLRVYNAAINGSRPNYIMGVHFANAVVAVPQADLIIYNHGHNIGSGGTWDTSEPLDGRTQLMLSGILPILEVHEGAGVLFNGQNPRRDDDLADLMHAAIVQAAALIGADKTDSYERTELRSRQASDYDDNIHPSPQWHSEVGAPALIAMHDGVIGKSAYCSLLDEKANLLTNGDFAAFDGAVPDGWTAVNTTASKDTTNYESANGYAVKLTWTGSGGSHNIYQSINGALLRRIRGKRVNFAVRLYIPDGSAASTGRIKIQSSGIAVTSRDDDQGQGGFIWKFISAKIPADALSVQAIVIGDGSTSGGSPSFDRAIMTIGATAHDNAIVSP